MEVGDRIYLMAGLFTFLRVGMGVALYAPDE